MDLDVIDGADLLRVEDAVWVLVSPPDRRQSYLANCYDFPLESTFECHRPWQRPAQVDVVARIGAFSSKYEEVYSALLAEGIRLVHSPDEHYRCSTLSQWYPLLAGLTPRSLWFDGPPDEVKISSELGWPIFMKGERQTSYHRRRLSILKSPDDLRAALETYAVDPVLCWQRIACREFIPLRPVEDVSPDRIPASFEFRTFWWKGELVGFAPYWWQARPYTATPPEQFAAIEIAREASRRIGVAFLVIDVAQTEKGEWIVIECNDGQESGYCKASPFAVWNEIIAAERRLQRQFG